MFSLAGDLYNKSLTGFIPEKEYCDVSIQSQKLPGK